MAYDYAERLYDFDRAADLPLRGRRLFLSRLIGGGFHRGGVGAAGVPA
jgi:hypothetical protein